MATTHTTEVKKGGSVHALPTEDIDTTLLAILSLASYLHSRHHVQYPEIVTILTTLTHEFPEIDTLGVKNERIEGLEDALYRLRDQRRILIRRDLLDCAFIEIDTALARHNLVILQERHRAIFDKYAPIAQRFAELSNAYEKEQCGEEVAARLRADIESGKPAPPAKKPWWRRLLPLS